MADVPVTRFARNGDVHLAYQVVGDGPVDLLFIDDWVHHVELVWEVAEFARFLRQLSGFARLIHFDRRGTGLSDPVPPDAVPDLETQVADVIAILDAAGRSARRSSPSRSAASSRCSWRRPIRSAAVNSCSTHRRPCRWMHPTSRGTPPLPAST